MEVGVGALDKYETVSCAWGAWSVNKRLHTSGTRLKIFGRKLAKSYPSGPGCAWWVQHPFGARFCVGSIKLTIFPLPVCYICLKYQSSRLHFTAS